MTATAITPETKDEAAGIGRVVRVIGPVVDVEFPAGQMPEILNALHVDTEVMGETHTINLEVALHIGENVVRAISLKPTVCAVAPRSVTPVPRSLCRWAMSPRATCGT